MVLFPIDGTDVAATASPVVRLLDNSTMLIEASSLKFFESEPPNNMLIAEDVLLFSGELVKGKTVALDVKVTGVVLAYNANNTPIIKPTARIIKRNFFNRLKINRGR